MDPLILLIVFVFVLVALFLRSPGVGGPSLKGARGERRIKKAIAAQLSKDDYHQFHDITLDTPDGTTQIDHIVVSRYGIFVIETKNYKGWIFGDRDAKLWTQVLYRKKYRFQNPLRQNYKHIKAVESFLALPTRFIHSVVVFVGESEFRTPVPTNVTSRRSFIPYIRSMQDRILSERQVSSITLKFAEHKFGNSSTKRHEPHLKIVSSHPVCSQCGNEMVLRTARKGVNSGKRFWGCSLYPKCKFTKDVS